MNWKEEAWNPILGCNIASAGCRHCYAMGIAGNLLRKGVSKYEGLVDLSRRYPVWTGVLRPDLKRLELPYSWTKPRRVFVNSMTDLFEQAVPDDYLLKIWEIMAKTPWHLYFLLTKRPERLQHFISKIAKRTLPNLWIGASVEHQKTAERIQFIRETPAAIRFISFEPLIGDVGKINLKEIDFIYVGGESGLRARPMQHEWIEHIFQTARRDGTGFSFHQWGAYGEDGIKRSRKENGNLFKGKTWHEIPVSAYDFVLEASKRWQSQQCLSGKSAKRDLFHKISENPLLL
ncbi:phage Gp37/Gp68 family protein [Acetobacteraceae bacterium]|nr:phage Gp37/Gp68 family protein [Acetobacteraceae bacterium]